MKQKDLRELFYIKSKTGRFRKRLNQPVCYETFKDILLSCVKLINTNAPEKFFKNKYKTYLHNFKKTKINRYLLLELGFFSQTTANINYYLTRGWPLKESKNF